MPKIVVVDNDFENSDFEERMAREAGVDIAVFHERDADAVIRNAVDADGIVTSYAHFPRRVFEALAPRLKVVSRTGVGYDSIDLEAATEYGVAICTAPGYGTEVVSDHAIALALCVLRRMNEIDADMRAGKWDYACRRPLGQVHGRTFGVVGMGEIGRATARCGYRHDRTRPSTRGGKALGRGNRRVRRRADRFQPPDHERAAYGAHLACGILVGGIGPRAARANDAKRHRRRMRAPSSRLLECRRFR